MVRTRQPAVYLMANKRNGTTYCGVTSDLPKRSYEHRNELVEGFTKRYGCKMLVWYELAETMDSAIAREKQLKGMSRKKKMHLIESVNPDWLDLYDSIVG